jgi:hypothetical protein
MPFRVRPHAVLPAAREDGIDGTRPEGVVMRRSVSRWRPLEDLEDLRGRIARDGVLEVTVPLPEKEAAARKVITPKPARPEAPTGAAAPPAAAPSHLPSATTM